MRQTVKEIEVNVAYRWFLGLEMMDKVPHFFYCLAHASDAVQILDEWNFNEHDRIHAGTAIAVSYTHLFPS